MWENDFKVNFGDDDFGITSDDNNKENNQKDSLASMSEENPAANNKWKPSKEGRTKEVDKNKEDLSANAFSSMAKKWISVDEEDLDMESEDKVDLEIIKNMKNKRQKKKQIMIWVYSLLWILLIGGVWLALVNNKDMLASLFIKKDNIEKEKKIVEEKEYIPLVAKNDTKEEEKIEIIPIVEEKEVFIPITWIVKLDQEFLLTPDMESFYEKYKKDFRYIKTYNTGEKLKEYYLRRMNLLMYDWKQKWLKLALVKKWYNKIMPSFQNKALEYEEWKEKKEKELANRIIEEQPIEEQPIEEQPIEEQPIEEQPIEEQPIEEQPIEEQPIEEQPIEEQPIEEQPIEEQPIEEQPIEEQPIEEQPIEEQPIEDLTGTSVEQSQDILPWDDGFDDLDNLEEITLPWETGAETWTWN